MKDAFLDHYYLQEIPKLIDRRLPYNPLFYYPLNSVISKQYDISCSRHMDNDDIKREVHYPCVLQDIFLIINEPEYDEI